MKILASQADLSSALRTVSRAVSNGRTHPVLAGVLLTAADGACTLTTYDLEIGITTSITAVVDQPGSVVIPHRLLADITAKLDGVLSLAVDGGRVELSAAGGSYSLSVASAEDFPGLPTLEAAAGDAVALQEPLAAVLPAVSHDAAKQLLTGVHVASDGAAVRLEATDGHRLALRTLEAAAPAFDAVIPARTMALIREPVLMACDGHHVSFTGGNGTTIISRTLDGRYPDVKALVPAKSQYRASVDRVALLQALERIAVIADSHNSVVKLADGKLTAEAEANSGAETVKLDGELPPLACNARYLIDGLKGFASDTIEIRSNGGTTPVVMADGDSIYLVMPVQVRD